MDKDKLDNKKIAIIGAGNMGSAIARGLVCSKAISSKNVIVSDPSTEKLQALEELSIETLSDNKKAVQHVNIVILAVKPQSIPDVLLEIAKVVSKRQLVISIAAGVEIKTIKRLLGKKQPTVRVMPNLCATIGMSVSCWTASKEVSRYSRRLIEKILRAVGTECFIDDESKFDQITAISGSGPAYVFYLAELLEETAKKIGLQKDLSRILSMQTIVGSAELMKNSAQSSKELRAGVTSRGGVTEAVFDVLGKHHIDNIFIKAIRAGARKAKELRAPH
jgi:pyrroline-5-carboxylate reductase